MKKLITLIIISSLILCACGSDKMPKGISEDTYEYGVKAVNLFDSYDEGEIGKEELNSRVMKIKDHLDGLSLEGEEETKNTVVSSYLFTILAALDGHGEDFYTQLDALKDVLGVK